MIESIRGRVGDVGEESVVLDSESGVAWLLLIPGSTRAVLPGAGESATLFAHLDFNPQDGEFTLFGFATRIERDVFRVFLSISGIGPRKAMGILSQVRIGEFARAIRDRDLRYLSDLKGVGKKTAERLVVELQDKIVPFLAQDVAGRAPLGGPGSAGFGAMPAGLVLPRGENIADAVAGLVALQMKPEAAARAVLKAIEAEGETTPAPQLIRAALKFRGV